MWLRGKHKGTCSFYSPATYPLFLLILPQNAFYPPLILKDRMSLSRFRQIRCEPPVTRSGRSVHERVRHTFNVNIMLKHPSHLLGFSLSEEPGHGCVQLCELAEGGADVAVEVLVFLILVIENSSILVPFFHAADLRILAVKMDFRGRVLFSLCVCFCCRVVTQKCRDLF